MEYQNKRLGRIKETIFYGRLLRGSLIGLAVFAFGFTFLPYILCEANAETLNLSINWGAVDLTLNPDVEDTSTVVGADGHGDVLFGTITPTAKEGSNVGTMKIIKKTIGIETTGKYYSVFLSMNGNTNSLNMSEDSMVSIPALKNSSNSEATWAAPSTFTGAGWGFAVPETNITVDGEATSSLPSFAAESIYTGSCSMVDDKKVCQMLNTDLTYASGGTTYTNSTWAAVPVKGSEQQIYKDETDKAGFGYSGTTYENGARETNNTFNVYYAVNVDSGVMAGTYSNRVLYTAIASAASLDQVSTNLARYYKFGGQGDTQTISFDLTDSTDGESISMDDITVYVIPHSMMVNADYDINDDEVFTTTAISAFNICEVKSLTITDRATITCTVPAGTTEDGTGNGSYDYWLHVDRYNYNYVSKISDGNEAAFTYVGLQTKKQVGIDSQTGEPIYEYYVTNMQQMTPGVCAQTYKWNKLWGDHAQLLAPDGLAAVNSETIITADGSANTNLTEDLADGSFALTDTRDGKRYVVRRMGNGECWMAQNLDLNLYNGMTLSVNDTNLNEDWTLSETTVQPTAKVGSTSLSWQATHGVESVTLYKGVWEEGDGEETEAGWTESVVASCTGGTQYLPCYTKVFTNPTTTANSIAYYTIADDGTKTASDATAYNGGTAYVGFTFYVRKLKFDSTSGTYNYDNVGDTCEMYVNKEGKLFDGNSTDGYNPSYNYCRVATSGVAAIMQYGDMTNKGYQTLGLPVITSTSTGNSTFDPTDSINAGRIGSTTGLNTNAHPTSAGDFRWRQNGDDGAHVYEPGMLVYTNNKADSAIAYTTGDPAAVSETSATCANRGSSTGTLGTFDVCLDENDKPLASTGAQGNWYNWYAATAGRGTSNASSDPTESICPKGWKLPVNAAANTKSFANLITNTLGRANSGSNRDVPILSAPLSYIRSGFYDWGHFEHTAAGPRTMTTWAYVWSSSRSGSNAYYLYYSATSLSPQSSYYRGYGFAVRCVAQ